MWHSLFAANERGRNQDSHNISNDGRKQPISWVKFSQVKSELLKSVTWINSSDPPW